MTFGEIAERIVSAGSEVCAQIAVQSAVLAATQDGGQWVGPLGPARVAKRSQLGAEHLPERARQ